MEYKLIKKFLPELPLRKASCMASGLVVDHISPIDLESELAKAKKWKDNDTQEIFIALKPIENQEPVSREEIIRLLISKGLTDEQELILERIKKNGVK